jgi:hypothetical protein
MDSQDPDSDLQPTSRGLSPGSKLRQRPHRRVARATLSIEPVVEAAGELGGAGLGDPAAVGLRTTTTSLAVDRIEHCGNDGHDHERDEHLLHRRTHGRGWGGLGRWDLRKRIDRRQRNRRLTSPGSDDGVRHQKSTLPTFWSMRWGRPCTATWVTPVRSILATPSSTFTHHSRQ